MTQINQNLPPERRSGGDGKGGIYAILVIIVVLIVGAVLYFSGVMGPRESGDDFRADIEIEAPDMPDIDVPDDIRIETPGVPDTVTITD
ncbi:MAG TPA: hypothetical protein VMR66_07930 [Gemmatimonadota bacterium]|nr:hypothetical protein [Gemmatimonadota bacterium]